MMALLVIILILTVVNSIVLLGLGRAFHILLEQLRESPVLPPPSNLNENNNLIEP